MKWTSFRAAAQDASALDATYESDAISNIMGAILLILLICLAIINPDGAEEQREIVPPGNITVELHWPAEINADIDLWVKAPQQRPIGYSNKVGKYYNHLRDDLGKLFAHDLVNYEFMTSRGIPSGQHCVNVHYYSSHKGAPEVPVKVSMTVSYGLPGENAKGSGAPDLVADVLLERPGVEKNVFCFLIQPNGRFEANEHTVFSSPAIRLRTLNEW